MKAFVINGYGAALHTADVPTPAVGDRDVLVRIAAASINPLDRMIRDGEFKQLLPYRFPLTLGHDVAGVVTAVGPGVTRFADGDEVFGRPRDLRIGTFAEFIAVDADDVAHKPSSLTMEQAAAVPLVALAAWQALVVLADVQPGHRVLVHAGAGGLGSTVIQLATHLGAHVTTTVRGVDADTVRALGADEVIDYTTADFAAVGKDFDVVLDSLGPASLDKSMTVLRPGGLVISVVGPPEPAFARQVGRPLLAPVLGLLSRKVRRRARALGVRYHFLFMRADGAQLAILADLYDKGALRPVLDRCFPFDQTAEALAYVEQGKAKGKIVVTVPPTTRD